MYINFCIVELSVPSFIGEMFFIFASPKQCKIGIGVTVSLPHFFIFTRWKKYRLTSLIQAVRLSFVRRLDIVHITPSPYKKK